jgi:hypothetical protein
MLPIENMKHDANDSVVQEEVVEDQIEDQIEAQEVEDQDQDQVEDQEVEDQDQDQEVEDQDQLEDQDQVEAQEVEAQEVEDQEVEDQDQIEAQEEVQTATIKPPVPRTKIIKGLTPNHTHTKHSKSMDQLDTFLENKKEAPESLAWCKLNKTAKAQKLEEYVDRYVEAHSKEDISRASLTTFLKECLEKKKLARVKDVIYDKTTGLIQNIPGLTYVKSRFTLKNLDTKHVSTLKSLPPKRTTTLGKKPSI